MSGYPFNCSSCGRFATQGSWAHQYDFVAMEPSHDEERCQACTDRYGPATSNARPYNNCWDQYEGRIVNGEYEYGSLIASRSARDSDGSPKGGDGEAGSVHDSPDPKGIAEPLSPHIQGQG